MHKWEKTGENPDHFLVSFYFRLRVCNILSLSVCFATINRFSCGRGVYPRAVAHRLSSE